ncbi:MAG: hypothetical protein ACMXYK_02355 [Candidatus Woesearchaeota archaeon]
MNNSKKGSISISINMIVYVVVGFVMLGLILTLGRQIIDQASGTASQVAEQTRQNIINELIRSDDPLYFTQRLHEVPFGRDLNMMFGIKNIHPSPEIYQVQIYFIHPLTGATFPIIPRNTNVCAVSLVNGACPSNSYLTLEDIGMTGNGNLEVGQFQWDLGDQRFGPGEGRPFDLTYRAPRAVNRFQFRIRIYDFEHVQEAGEYTSEGIVAEQAITISVV